MCIFSNPNRVNVTRFDDNWRVSIVTLLVLGGHGEEVTVTWHEHMINRTVVVFGLDLCNAMRNVVCFQSDP